MSDAGHKEVLAGRYRLLRRLAEGGMATVWEGHDEILARRVAVKIPHSQLASDPAYRERFRREAVAAARLAHPGIVSTYDTGADGPIDFIVMELVPGRTVRDLVAGGPVRAEVALPIAAQVADALDAAHQAGIIHRDIKPANLLLLEDGAVPRVKVADFGVARAREVLDQKRTETSVTADGVVLGTARYLAPEQVTAGHIDGRTDIYALGCVLHELLAGQPPFVRETDLAIALAQMTEPPPPLRSLGAPVDPALEGLVLACLAKEPGHRPASAAALARELRVLATPRAAPPTAAVPVIDLASANGASATRPPAPSRRGTRAGGRPPRSRVPLVLVGCLVLVALFTALVVVAAPGSGPKVSRGPTGPAAAGSPTITGVRSFDPAPGDGRENDGDLRRLTDGNPSTTWSSDRYRQPPVFGNLKKGVGVVLALREPATLGKLRVSSTSRAWAAQVYVAAAPATALSGWGQPVTKASGIEGDLELDLEGKVGGAVLLWFTDPGRTGQLVVGELALEGPKT
ncbi:MAG: protein kinase [Acidimicrobiales bacterium]